MTHAPITFVYESQRGALATQNEPTGADSRFVEELRRFSGQSVPVVRGPVDDILSTDGFLIIRIAADRGIFPHESARLVEAAPRVVLIGTDRTGEWEHALEANLVAAAIDKTAFQDWCIGTPVDGAWNLYGRRDIGRLIGADCFKPYTARYCHLFSTSHLGLPHLLCDYLAAIEQAGAST